MRIKNLEIKNFKCLGPDSLGLDFSENILVLIGENNVGKSAVLKALTYYFSGTKTIPIECFYNKQTDIDHAIVVCIEFDGLSAKDKEHQAISPYVSKKDTKNETWTLKKIYYHGDDGKGKCDYVCIVNGEEKRNPGGLPQNCDDLFTDDKMQKIIVEAVKDVNEVTEGTNKSTFGQVFNLVIKDAIEGTDAYKRLMAALADYQALFRGKFSLQEIKNTEDLINQRLARIMRATGKIDTDPPKADKILPTPKLLTNDGRDVDVEPSEQGHGLQRTIIFTLLELLAETASPIDKEVGPKNLLLIEEPEIYMHPQMERKIADTLYEIAASGKAQVICTTHSPIFIRIAEKHKAIARFIRKSDNSLEVKQKDDIFFGADKEDKRKQLQMITNFDPTVNEIFFAKRVVLVEGDTEIAVFRESAEVLKYFETEQNKPQKRDTTFVNCRGKGLILLFQEVMNHFEIEYIVIHDKDNENLDKGTNGKILGLLGNDETRRMVFDTNIESVISIGGGPKEKAIKALEQIRTLNSNNTLETKLGKFVKFAYNLI